MPTERAANEASLLEVKEYFEYAQTPQGASQFRKEWLALSKEDQSELRRLVGEVLGKGA